MPVVRVVILWHQHQPFYKDLVSGEYRLPWVRLHALKDYYGMVKLLDEFPGIHQTFNLVPSLISQIQDYVGGTAHDPFLHVAAKPATDLTADDRRFALQYLFQANPTNMIGRYPRYRELWQRYRSSGDSPERAEKFFQPQDFTDLQVLSQIAWFDEFFLEQAEIAGLIKKGHGYSLEDQHFVIIRQRELLQQVFGMRPRGVWPSEGSVSDEVLAIAHGLGIQWMATDEGVLGRSQGIHFSRDGSGRLPSEAAAKLYTVHRYDNGQTVMNMLFRDHTLSDLIGFVYSGMPAEEAARHLMQNIKSAAQLLLDMGRDAVIPIILDGENAWEYYPRSGREFLRRFYTALQEDPGVEAVTVSEAIERHRDFGHLASLVPGSWINANFNVWIGAPEDNRSWDYLYHARNFFTQTAPRASEAQRKMAFEELLIAEGSDWNWWYGPEHHSANDRDFDELYRKHLSNVYQALGATPPDYLAQPIAGGLGRPSFAPQTAYIHPRITGDVVRYFEWMGAARYTADHRAGAMHGKQFLLDAVYAGIDENYVYGRLDFSGDVPGTEVALVVNLESWSGAEPRPRRSLRLDAIVQERQLQEWKVSQAGDEIPLDSCEGRAHDGVKLALGRNFEFRLPLSWLLATPVSSGHNSAAAASVPATSKLRLRFSLWQKGLPVDALPLEGWIELELLSEADLMAMEY